MRPYRETASRSGRARPAESRRRQEWAQASTRAATTLLSASPDDALADVVRTAREVAGAGVAWIVVADGSVTVLEQDEGSDAGFAAALGAALVPGIAESGAPLVLDDAACELDGPAGLVAHIAEIGPLVAVPLQSATGFHGVLVLAKRTGQAAFDRLDVELSATFAGHAAIALEFGRAQGDRERLRVVEDRDRIARDLHDVVIQRVFAIGLRLELLARRLPAEDAEHLGTSIEELNHTIHDVRNAIFDLRTEEVSAPPLTDRLAAVIERAAGLFGFVPALRIDGSLAAIPDALHLGLLTALNESLLNVARRASARSVAVRLSICAQLVHLVVRDDGPGPAISWQAPLPG